MTFGNSHPSKSGLEIAERGISAIDPSSMDDLATSSLLEALLEQTREAVLLVRSKDQKVLRANPRALELLGWSPEDLKNRCLEEIARGEGGEILASRIASLKQPGSSCSFEGYLFHADGYAFSCEMDISCTGTAENPFLLLTFQDVTEKIQAREDIELRNIAIANVVSGVTVADARQPDLPLIYVNKGFQTMTGYSARESIGRSCRFLQGEERDQPGLEELRDALRTGSPCVVRLKNYKKDGTLFFNELHISPVHNDRGELTHFVGIQLDVTDQEKARKSLERSEAQYRQALEQEKQLNEIKTRFISMVSHEFRTPMTGIQASAVLLRKFGAKLAENKKAQHLSNIEISLKRMNRLLDDVLFFSQAESDKLKVTRKDLFLADYLQSFIERLTPIYPGRILTSECLIPNDQAFSLDEHLLDHILQNLISNALKYSEKDSEVHCKVSANKDSIQLSVIDNGIGIPLDDQPKLFDAFHRAGNAGTRQGTGLGLNIVRRAVELLGGTISFESEENKGSTFTVSLPVNPNPKGTK
jgi:PAS domain S-box-containing protein